MLRESLTRHHPVAVATDLRDTLHNADVPLRPTMREHGNEASVTPALESMGTRLVMMIETRNTVQ